MNQLLKNTLKKHITHNIHWFTQEEIFIIPPSIIQDIIHDIQFLDCITAIDLSFNGKINNDWLKIIRTMKLQNLNLSHCLITLSSFVPKKKKSKKYPISKSLISLNLSYVQNLNLKNIQKMFPLLQNLSLEGCSYITMKHFTKIFLLKDLKLLNLKGCKKLCLNIQKKEKVLLPKVEVLNLGCIGSVGSFSRVFNFQMLVYLNLNNNVSVCDKLFENINFECQNLSTLYVSKTKIKSLKFLKYFPNITAFDISYNELTIEICTDFNEFCENIIHLNLSYCKNVYPNMLLVILEKIAVKIISLDVSNLYLNSSVVELLGTCSNLLKLTLNYVVCDYLFLRNLKKLNELNLVGVSFGDVEIFSGVINQLKELRKIDLTDSKASASQKKVKLELKKLSYLDLRESFLPIDLNGLVNLSFLGVTDLRNKINAKFLYHNEFSLKYLILKRICNAEMLKVIGKCSNLKMLDIEGSKSLENDHFLCFEDPLKNLVDLNLKNCTGLSDKVVRVIAEAFPNLLKLNLIGIFLSSNGLNFLRPFVCLNYLKFSKSKMMLGDKFIQRIQRELENLVYIKVQPYVYKNCYVSN